MRQLNTIEVRDPTTTAVEVGQQLAVKYIQNEVQAGRLLVLNRAINMDERRKILFVHNPKCMGTSVRKWLGLRIDNADHRYPTLMVDRTTWETWRTIVVVRNPIDRFISSYNFHCRSPYSGGYLSTFPDLKSWSMERYFHTMTQHKPYAVAPQWRYTMHLETDVPADHIIRFEEPGRELARIAIALNLPAFGQRLNQNNGEKTQPSRAFRAELEQYYARDFELFGY